MKMIFMVFSEAIENEVMQTLEKCAIKTYTRANDLVGVGGRTEPRLNSSIWPGTNHGLFIATDENKVALLLKEVKTLKNKYKNEGLKAFVMPLEEAV